MQNPKLPKVRQTVVFSDKHVRGTEIGLMDHLAQSSQDLSGHYEATTACLLITLVHIPALVSVLYQGRIEPPRQREGLKLPIVTYRRRRAECC